jgi:acyl dehydratase
MKKDNKNSTNISDLWKINFEEKFHRTFTFDDIISFSNLSRDKSPIHTNSKEALKRNFTDVVVHGCLINSGFSYLIGMKIPGENALLLNLNTKFHNPLYPNETVMFSAKIESLHDSVSCINLKLLALKSSGLKVCSGNAVVKVLV